MKNFRGVTALELLVSIAILLLAAWFIGGLFSGFRESTRLTEAHTALVGLLRDARARTLASESNSVYGVHFETNLASLFKGAVYNSSDSSNENYVLPNTVEISAINLAGGAQDIVFARLSGLASASGDVTVRSVSDSSKTKTITIIGSGAVK